MLKLTKFLSLHDKFFSQNIPIRNNALARIRIAFHINTLSIPEIICFDINGISGLNCIPFEGAFRILLITVIGSSMCLGMEGQKDITDGAAGCFSTYIPWRLKWLRSRWWIEQGQGWIELEGGCRQFGITTRGRGGIRLSIGDARHLQTWAFHFH